MSKRIVRLTESDLMRIVKRVIKENQGTPNLGVATPGVNPRAAEIFCNALGKDSDDEEEEALAAVKMLRTGKDVYDFAALVQSKEGMTLTQFFNEYMSEADPEYPKIVQHIRDITYRANAYLNIGEESSLQDFLRAVRQTIQGKREN